MTVPRLERQFPSARPTLRSVEAGALLVLVLLLSNSLLSLEECLSVLVELQGSDSNVGRVHGDLDLLA